MQADVFALGVLDDRLAHLRTVHQALDQVAPVRHIGADDRGLLLAKVHPQDALNHAQGALVALVLRDQFTQLDGRGELHAGLAPQDQDAGQAAQAPGDCPAVGEQQLPGAGLAVRRLAPEHADRDDLRIVQPMLGEGADQALQGRRNAALVLAAEPVRLRGQVEERRRLQHLAQRDRQHRARQAGLAALRIDHRQVAQ
ncbi:hypothetical protein D3C84_763380 [compost metagenome]